MSTVVIKTDRAALRKMLKSPEGQVARGIYKLGKKVERRAKRLVPVDHGILRASITTELVIRGVPIARVGTKVKYALYVHEGTGLYGPKHSLIRPVRSKFMVFKPKGAKGLVFARTTKGMKGKPYLRRALIEVVGTA